MDGITMYPTRQTIGPIRILVQTKTHLVPGKDYFEKELFMLHLMCNRHLHRNYNPEKDRHYARGAQFGYPDRPCYFLLDHGQASNDAEVPIMWYEWTGNALEPLQQPLPANLQIRLKEKYPFTKRPIQDLPKRPPLDDNGKRKLIKHKLRCLMGLRDRDLEFMEEYPAHAKWLKDTIEPQFWSEYESLAADWRKRVEHTVSVSVHEDKRDNGGQISGRAHINSPLGSEPSAVRNVEGSSGCWNEPSVWARSAGEEAADTS